MVLPCDEAVPVLVAGDEEQLGRLLLVHDFGVSKICLNTTSMKGLLMALLLSINHCVRLSEATQLGLVNLVDIFMRFSLNLKHFCRSVRCTFRIGEMRKHAEVKGEMKR